VLWTPPATRDPDALAAAVATALADLGARPWQIELTGPAVTEAILAADREPPAESAASAESTGATDADPAPEEEG
jgi:ribonuclease D